MDHTLRQGDRNRFAQGGWLNGCRLACSPFGDYVDHGPIGYLEIGGCKTADHFNTQESHIGVGEAQVDAESAGCDSIGVDIERVDLENPPEFCVQLSAVQVGSVEIQPR